MERVIEWISSISLDANETEVISPEVISTEVVSTDINHSIPEWLSNLRICDSDEDDSRIIDLLDDEWINFVAKPRTRRTKVTPHRYTELWPRGQSSPKFVIVRGRRLNFDNLDQYNTD